MYNFNSCITLSYSLTSHYDFMSIKGSIELYVKIHNYREESCIVPEELVSYLQSLYLVLLFSLILQHSLVI
jgi:hypothetical protein